jgi:integrase/recombinase XerD
LRGFLWLEWRDLNPRPSGSRLLRHTAATNLIQGGATLKEIADILGHSSIDTTAIYTKVDLPTLREIALPWPGVK